MATATLQIWKLQGKGVEPPAPHWWPRTQALLAPGPVLSKLRSTLQEQASARRALGNRVGQLTHSGLGLLSDFLRLVKSGAVFSSSISAMVLVFHCGFLELYV